MLLTITCTCEQAADLSYLLHKHPDKEHEIEIAAGVAYVFYPEVSANKCTVCLLLDIDPIALVRRSSGPRGNDFALERSQVVVRSPITQQHEIFTPRHKRR
jgi:hypothetical protein